MPPYRRGFPGRLSQGDPPEPQGISSGEKLLWQTLITVLALAALLWFPASGQKIREFWVPFHKEPVWIFTGDWG